MSTVGIIYPRPDMDPVVVLRLPHRHRSDPIPVVVHPLHVLTVRSRGRYRRHGEYGVEVIVVGREENVE